MAPGPHDEAMLLLAAGRERRARTRARLAELLGRADFAALAAELRRRRLLPLLGTRALETAGDAAPAAFRDAVARAVATTRARGLAVEAATRRAVAALEAAGLRALPLKGPLLAQDAHGDLGLRDTEDVDVLVRREDLHAGVRALSGAGYRLRPGPRRPGGLPDLHLDLVHATLAPVELHWRVHWYETAFSARLLERAEPGPGGLLRPRPDDLAVALLLFHARDGLQGLRYPCDLAGWWDRRWDDDAPLRLEGHVRDHPELAAPLTAAATAVERVTGTPATRWLGDARARGRRVALATRLADWAQREDRDQLTANVALVDCLLGPGAALRDCARRELRLPGAPAAAAVAHPLKVSARWAWALWRVRGGRVWTEVPGS
jgi:hypothetical protein